MQEHRLEGSGALCVAQALHAHGIERVYGVCGDHINSLYAALHQVGIELIGMRSESAAVQMADGHARATGRPAVAMVTGGPGHTNAITGLAVAHAAAAPVILISGLTPVVQRHRGGQQVMEQARIAAPVTKQARELLHGDHLWEDVAMAIRVAQSGTPGPVSLSIPVDVLTGRAPVPQKPQGAAAHRQALPSGGLDADTLERIRALIGKARKPALILGAQAWRRGLPAGLPPALQRWGIPVFTIEQAQGMVPDDGEQGFGYADPFFNATFRDLRKADLVILAGAGIDFHTCFGGEQLLDPAARILQIHPDAARLDACLPADVAVCADPAETLMLLAQQAPPHSEARQWKAALGKLHASKASYWREMLESLPKAPGSIHPLELCFALARHKTPRTGIVVDAGDFVHWPRAYFAASAPGHWMDASLMGNLGGSLPLAMGMQQAFPQDPVWAFAGDGGFGFYSWDLATAVDMKLPIKVIVGNDRAWGIEKRLQLADYGHDTGCDLPDIRYDQYAELVGARGFHLNERSALEDVVAAFVATPGPALLNVDIPQLAGRPLGDFKRY
ncbi:MAG: thiamine pyrophosphate-binding protein [Burkholderiaceae bacterium]